MFLDEYKKWLDSNMLSAEEKEELKSIVNDEKEIELNVWELTSGCACCSTKADFMSSLLAIDNTLNPDFLIVEPSGIAVLSNILNNVNIMKKILIIKIVN